MELTPRLGLPRPLHQVIQRNAGLPGRRIDAGHHVRVDQEELWKGCHGPIIPSKRRKGNRYKNKQIRVTE